MLTATEHKCYGFKGLHVLNTSYNFETKNDIVSKYIFFRNTGSVSAVET